MGASAEVTRAAEIYFHVRIWSAPFALANYVLLGWLSGSRAPVSRWRCRSSINVVNIAVIVVAGAVLGLGVAGAAFAARDRGGDRD